MTERFNQADFLNQDERLGYYLSGEFDGVVSDEVDNCTENSIFADIISYDGNEELYQKNKTAAELTAKLLGERNEDEHAALMRGALFSLQVVRTVYGEQAHVSLPDAVENVLSSSDGVMTPAELDAMREEIGADIDIYRSLNPSVADFASSYAMDIDETESKEYLDRAEESFLFIAMCAEKGYLQQKRDRATL